MTSQPNACGLTRPHPTGITGDLEPVSYAMPSRKSGKSITSEELAEKLGMDLAEVNRCLGVLTRIGWVSPGPEGYQR